MATVKKKAFPTPHLEVRVFVSDEMQKDYKECRQAAKSENDGKDCEKCSWNDVVIGNFCMCQLKEMNDLLDEEEKR